MALRYWRGQSQDFSAPINWSATSGGPGGASVPTSADDVIFDNSALNKTINTYNKSTNLTCRNFYVNSSGYIFMATDSDGGTVHVYGNVHIEHSIQETGVGVSQGMILHMMGNSSVTLRVPEPSRFMLRLSGTGRTITLSGDVSIVTDAVRGMPMAAHWSGESYPLSNVRASSGSITIDTNGNDFNVSGIEALSTASLTIVGDIRSHAVPTEIPLSGHSITQHTISGLSKVSVTGDIYLMRGDDRAFTLKNVSLGGIINTTTGAPHPSSEPPHSISADASTPTQSITKTSGTILLENVKLKNTIVSGGANFRAPTNLGNVDEGGNTGWNFSPLRVAVKKDDEWLYTLLDGKLNKGGVLVDL